MEPNLSGSSAAPTPRYTIPPVPPSTSPQSRGSTASLPTSRLPAGRTTTKRKSKAKEALKKKIKIQNGTPTRRPSATGASAEKSPESLFLGLGDFQVPAYSLFEPGEIEPVIFNTRIKAILAHLECTVKTHGAILKRNQEMKQELGGLRETNRLLERSLDVVARDSLEKEELEEQLDQANMMLNKVTLDLREARMIIDRRK